LELEGQGATGKNDLLINITQHPCPREYGGNLSPKVCTNLAPGVTILNLATEGEKIAVPIPLKDGTRWIEAALSNPNPDGGALIENLILKELPRERTKLENELAEILKTEAHPVLNAVKINPTFYQLEIERPDSPVSLIFSETFDPHWKLDSSSFKEPLASQRANLFANGWQLDPQDFLGNEETIQLEVKYELQELWERCAQLSAASLISLIGWSLWKRPSKRTQKS